MKVHELTEIGQGNSAMMFNTLCVCVCVWGGGGWMGGWGKMQTSSHTILGGSDKCSRILCPGLMSFYTDWGIKCPRTQGGSI